MKQMKQQLCRPITCNKCQKLVTKWIAVAKPANVSFFIINNQFYNLIKVNRCLRVIALPNCCEFRNYNQGVF